MSLDENGLPIIGQTKVRQCTYCEKDFKSHVNPIDPNSLITAPVCNCFRPVFIGDLTAIQDNLNDYITNSELSEEEIATFAGASGILSVILAGLKRLADAERGL